MGLSKHPLFILLTVCAVPCLFSASVQGRINDGRGSMSDYDAGPDLSTQIGRGYAEIFSEIPNYRALEGQLFGTEKRFQWEFGPVFYRGRLGKDHVKVLIIGQDDDPMSQLTSRAFSGNTGQQLQNVLDYIGIQQSYLFLNAFSYPMLHGYKDVVPVLVRGAMDSTPQNLGGAPNWKIQWMPFLNPSMYWLAQDEASPIVQWRNQLIDYVIHSNENSLKLVIALGDAGQDAVADYIVSKGGNCHSAVSETAMVDLGLLNYKTVKTSENTVFSFPVDTEGKNALSNPHDSVDYTDHVYISKLKRRAKDLKRLSRLVELFTGPYENGVRDIRQFGVNLSSCEVDGVPSTLRGLYGVREDVRVVAVNAAQIAVHGIVPAIGIMKKWETDGDWHLNPDAGNLTHFLAGESFEDVPKAIPRKDFRFGMIDLAGTRGYSVRLADDGHSIDFGIGNDYEYDADEQFKGTYKADDVPDGKASNRFDPGPSRSFAAVLNSEAFSEIFSRGQGRVFYRGHPEQSEVLILADQMSQNDLWVGRALMGYEGQKLQGFLQGIGAENDYTILRTLPIDTVGVSDESVKNMVNRSHAWRARVWHKLLFNPENTKRVRLIFTFGSHADAEIINLETGGLPVVSLTNGFKAAFDQIQKVEWKKNDFIFTENPVSIPREDIPFGVRLWVGTAGNRVIRSTYSGILNRTSYKITTPDWLNKQSVPNLTSWEIESLRSFFKFTGN